MRFLGSRSDKVYALFRFFSGALFACHGAQKLFGVLGGHQEVHDPLMLAAGLIEFAGGILVALGLHASPAAFVASGEMAVGYFKVHAHKAFWPIQNGGELAVLYCFVFLFIAAHGSGRPSLDASRHRRG
jgi:putative oxidoreductase